MPELVQNKAVVRKTPRLEVTNAFKAGRYVFHLVVEDDAGNRSDPSQIVVTVQAPGRRRLDPRVVETIRRRGPERLIRPGRVIRRR